MPSFTLYLFNLYLYVAFLVISATVIPILTIYVVILGVVIPSRRRTMKRFRRAISWYGLAVISVPYPFIRVYFEHQSYKPGGERYIFVANHRSAIDAFLMGVIPHELVQIVNIWPFRIPVLGFYAKLAGYLNIRMMPPDQFMEKATSLLDDRVSIVFFPEGTRSTGSEMGSFHSSAFRLALESKAAIIPLCISGAENVMPKGSSLLRPGNIIIRELPALTVNDYRNVTAYALKNRVRNMMDKELSVMECTV